MYGIYFCQLTGVYGACRLGVWRNAMTASLPMMIAIACDG
jgi:hypothetical protein